MEGTFRLKIDLGNDAMSTSEDVADALREIARRVEQTGLGPDLVERYLIRDRQDYTVGYWKVRR